MTTARHRNRGAERWCRLHPWRFQGWTGGSPEQPDVVSQLDLLWAGWAGALLGPRPAQRMLWLWSCSAAANSSAKSRTSYWIPIIINCLWSGHLIVCEFGLYYWPGLSAETAWDFQQVAACSQKTNNNLQYFFALCIYHREEFFTSSI